MNPISDPLPEPDPSLPWVGADEKGHRGARQLQLLEHWGLRPASRVLEIGCGIGRLAYALAPYLEGGAYSGFDVMPEPIAWLRANYASRLSNFRFDLVDARNPRFRPEDGAPAERVRFPYDDDTFDIACAFDVFMHMQLPEIGNYLAELTRVVRAGSPAVITLMLITERDTKPRYAGRDFVPTGDGIYTRHPKRVGVSLAYRDTLFRDTLREAGLEIVEEIEGGWRYPMRRPEPGTLASGADLVVVRKPDTAG